MGRMVLPEAGVGPCKLFGVMGLLCLGMEVVGLGTELGLADLGHIWTFGLGYSDLAPKKMKIR